MIKKYKLDNKKNRKKKKNEKQNKRIDQIKNNNQIIYQIMKVIGIIQKKITFTDYIFFNYNKTLILSLQ